MADAVILHAVAILAIAALADGRIDNTLLFIPRDHSCFTFVVRTARALADTRNAGIAQLEADAVQLAA